MFDSSRSTAATAARGYVVDSGAPKLIHRALGFVLGRPELAPLAVPIRWGFVFYKELSRDLAFVRAAGMAYATLVAMVPGLALIYGVIAATGAGGLDPERVLREFFNRIFGDVPELTDMLLPALAAVDLRAIGIVSTLGLLLVASRLYLMVEKAYCDVFGVPVRRGFGVRLLNFYFTITAVPIAWVLTLRGSFTLAQGTGLHHVSEIAGLVLQFGVLVMALKLLPATSVRWKPAILGASVSFMLLEFGRRFLGIYVTWVAAGDPLKAVYGSLAFVPVFLLWIYLIWVFVLLGVEVAQVTQNYDGLVEKELELADNGPQWPSVESAMRVAVWVGWSFSNGRGPMSIDELHARTGLEGRALHDVLAILKHGGIVVHADEGWMLARPASAIQMAEVQSVWRESTALGISDDALGKEISASLEFEGTLADGVRRWLPSASPSLVTVAR